MGDRPLLPSVRSLLDMDSRMLISPNDHHHLHLPSPQSERRSHHRTPQLAERYTSTNPHYRNKSSISRMDRDLNQQSSSRTQKILELPRSTPSSLQPTRPPHYSRNDPSRLPSVSEVLGSSARDSRMTDPWLPTSPISTPSNQPSSSHPASSTKKHGYPCERCGRLFTRKSDAQKHIRVVHDRVKNFACAVCGRRFGRKDYCTKHEKSKHNVVTPPTPYQLRRKLAKQKSEGRREDN